MGTRMELVVLSVKIGIISGSLEDCKTSGRRTPVAAGVYTTAKIIKAIYPRGRAFRLFGNGS